MDSKVKRTIIKCVVYFVILVALISALWPVLISLSVSFKPPEEVQKYPPKLIPKRPTFQNFKTLMVGRNFLKYISNTIIIALATTIFSVCIGSLGAYALSRYRFIGSKFLSQSVLLVYMFPPVLLIIPLYLMISSWNLVDTRFSLIIAYTTFSLPLCIWLLKGFFDGLPTDIEDAARIDGCSELRILIRVVIPLSAPGMMAAAAFSFMLVWIEYMFAVTFVTSGSRLTLTAGIASVVGQYWAGYGMLMAASILATIPALFFFFAAQRLVIKGLVTGAVKG